MYMYMEKQLHEESSKCGKLSSHELAKSTGLPNSIDHVDKAIYSRFLLLCDSWLIYCRLKVI